MSSSSLTVIASPSETADEVSELPISDGYQTSEAPHKNEAAPGPATRLNDPALSSRYYVSISDPDQVNPLLAMRGIPLVKGKQVAGLPMIRVLDLDPKTLAEMRANSGVDRILPYMTPEFEDPIPEEYGASITSDPSLYDYDVDVVQGATEAWSLGYTGTGVKIAVIDTGFDLAHPDLQGQQARYSSGPYSGWPIVYDDYSAILWSLDVAGGWVANTTATSNDTGGFVNYEDSNYSIANITDALGNPVASASGVYHIGYHTDWNLISNIGYPVGVLVVDATTPGVYDTVYVDLLGDYDFGNDKPCTKGDEISYFDSYDSATNTTQNLSWNAGDGYADVSGGMMYWISDGANVLPGSNWTYGATFAPPSGYAVAFVGEFTLGQSHGTMTASAALAAGRSMGGLLGGMAPDAKLIAIPFTFNIYNSWQFAENGADGLPDTGDEANIVSNSYGWSEAAVDAGYEYIDQAAGQISLSGPKTLWCWAAGNGGPGYGTTASVVDFSSIRVGAGTTMQYRTYLEMEASKNYSKWGDIAPFSNSGPTRTGKLNPEIIASGLYSLEPAPLNRPDNNGTIGDGSKHFQIGSGTSHAAPTVAGGAALGFQAYFASSGSWPGIFLAKATLMASSDDMHFDPLKQGAGWLNASNYVKIMGSSDGTVSTTTTAAGGYPAAALYPGKVYYRAWDSYPNFMVPGEQDSHYAVLTKNLNASMSVIANISAELLIRTSSVRVNHTTASIASEYVDITGHVLPGTDLLKVTMFLPLSVFDPNLDLVSGLRYNLELDDWVDHDADGVMNTTDASWELYRYAIDSGDCNYNQVMIRDPMERTHDGLIAGLTTLIGVAGVNFSLQIDCYELRTFPWVEFRKVGDTNWTPTLSLSIPAAANVSWNMRATVPLGTVVGTYAAAVYIDSGDRVQCLPIVINVPATTYEFTYGEQSPFDTPYNNNFTGLANKQWRYDTGDWRIYWSLPSTAPPNSDAHLMASVEWSERPTNVNVYVLAAEQTSFSSPPFIYGPLDSPWGPGWDMTMIASSDDQYDGNGVFGIETNTGGPKVVVAAPLGRWMADTLLVPTPFAILLRCPVMAGNYSEDHFSGYTTWVTVNGYDPDSITLNITVPGATPLNGQFNGTYNITTASPVEVRGGGSVELDRAWTYIEQISQDLIGGPFEQNLANAAYTYNFDAASVSTLTVSTQELFGAPDLDLGLWLDKNRDGIAQLSEPHWYSGVLGSTEEIELKRPASGTYLVKVLGYVVTGSPGYFFMTVSLGVEGLIQATGFETPASSGEHGFVITYNLTASPGTFEGEATFGFLGAMDMFSIPVTITITDQPRIEKVTPADKSVTDSTDLFVSFYFNDEAGANLGVEPSSVRIFLDGILNLSPWADISGNNVTLSYSFSLAQGWHIVTIVASDLDGNAAEPVSNTFFVNSLIESFTYTIVNPTTNATIENGATVALRNVTIVGSTDPGATVQVEGRSGTSETVANVSGAFEIGIDLEEGVNVLLITTVNNANASATGTLIVVSDTMCMLSVDSVGNLTGADEETISGTAEPGTALTVNDVAASVSPNGTWSQTVTLTEGENTVYINATDLAGNRATGALFITSDRTPPELNITSHSNGAQLSSAVVVISGTVEPGASVVVNGVLLTEDETVTGAWSARLALFEGTNVITIAASDSVGNLAETTLTLVYVPQDYVTPEELEDADDFASLVMFLAIILFLIAVFFTGAVWYIMGSRLKAATKPGEDEESLEEIEEERPKDVEQEFEDLEKEIRRDEGA